MEVVSVLGHLVLRTVVELRAELSRQVFQSAASEGVALDKGIGRGRPSLALGPELPGLDEGVRGANDEVGLAFGPFGNGLEADPFLPVVVELVLDDAQQSFVELEEGFDLHLVLGVQLLLLLDVVEVVLDLLLDRGILALQGLHAMASALLGKSIILYIAWRTHGSGRKVVWWLGTEEDEG